MRLSKRTVRMIVQLEPFKHFFAEEMDQWLQYVELEEMAKAVFGSLEKAVNEFVRQDRDFNFLARKKKV